jgi:threonyl-tRNA synthetase
MSTEKKTDDLHAMRHSLAHIMANAVQQLWPDAKFGVGPVVENGFYYDIDLGDVSLSEEHFATIEKEMKKIIDANETFERIEMNIDEAIKWAEDSGQPYKVELLNDLKRSGTTLAKDIDVEELGVAIEGDSKVENVSFYRNGDFTDLCRGPHVESTGKVGSFKLMRISGAYWRGKEGNPQMQRVYGVAFANEKDLRVYLQLLEEAKQRDHRKLGQELDLFTISELIGAGLPLFTPRGSVLREELGGFSQELQARYGFERVWTPHMAREELYKTSGHFEKFPEKFTVTSAESTDTFMMKPMNCPHHIQLFARKPWSYRELPVRYMENTTNYRDEKSGELHGLSRVRSLSQDDGHIFLREDDMEKELSAIVKMVKQFYKTLDMSFYARLSYRDEEDKYLGEANLWQKAEAAIAKVAKEEELESVDGPGEAAFYGPKIDFMVKDALGREWQCATIQLDFVQPERFGLTYTEADGTKKQPVMIHKALLGAVERFLSVYIEHTAGKFPVWLAPEQIRLVTVNAEPETVEFANNIKKQANEVGLRVHVDDANESVGKKIRLAEVMKVPYVVVIGQNEMTDGMLNPRIRKDLDDGEEHKARSSEDLLKVVSQEASSRAIKTTL